MKKVLAIIFCLALVIAAVPLSASAAYPTNYTVNFTAEPATVAQGGEVTIKLVLPDFNAHLTATGEPASPGMTSALFWDPALFTYKAGSFALAASPSAKSDSSFVLDTSVAGKLRFVYADSALAKVLTVDSNNVMYSFKLTVNGAATTGATAVYHATNAPNGWHSVGRDLVTNGTTTPAGDRFLITYGTNDITTRSTIPIQSFGMPSVEITAAGPTLYDWDGAKNSFDDRNAFIKYSNGWTNVNLSNFKSGTAMKATATGLTASFTVNNQFRLWGYKSTTQGDFTVSIDGGAAVDVSLYENSLNNGFQVVYTSPAISAGNHTVVITTKNNKPVQLDQIDVATASGALIENTGIAQANILRIEDPVSGQDCTEFRGVGWLWSNAAAWKVGLNGAVEYTIPSYMKAGDKIRIGTYKSPTQGVMHIQIGAANPIRFTPGYYDLVGPNTDSVSCLDVIELTLPVDASELAGKPLIIGADIKTVYVDYVEFETVIS